MRWIGREYAHFDMKSRLIKGTLTVLGAIALSIIGIFAADSLQGIKGGIGQIAGVGGSTQGICTEGATPLTIDGRVICIDTYEVSPGNGCPHKMPNNIVESENNAKVSECYGASVPDAMPWTYVTLPQAQRICATTGKRLPTSEEWYHIALGTEPDTCVISGTAVVKTGTPGCVSSVGAYDLVGNVWEWVYEEVVGKSFNGRELPEEGYVTSVDSQGVAVTSGQTADELYGKDYIWTKGEGVFGMIRGGFYGSNQDAGLYTLNASVPTGFATQGVGFRCVKDVF